MPRSTEVLSIRVSHADRELLILAAGQAKTNLSNYARRKAVEGAEMDVLDRRNAFIALEQWERFAAWAERPWEERAVLRALAAGPSSLEGTTLRPLNADDDRFNFDCGRELLDRWLRRRALASEQAHTARTTVAIHEQTGRIAAYVSLSRGEIEPLRLRSPMSQDRPNALPVVVLGQLAVDRTFKARGCARALLRFACATAVRAAGDVGSFGILTHPLDDNARAFFKSFGFVDLMFERSAAMLIRTGDMIASGLSHQRP